MAQTIKLKRSATTGNAPTTSQLALGELGINTTDGKLFLKKSVSGTESIVEVGGLPLSGGTLTGNLSLGDNVKLQLGNQTNGDLQIYHDGSTSYIADVGTGDLVLQAGNDLILRQPDGLTEYLRANEGAGVQIYHNGSQKFLTTAAGIDVTGTATMDGLTVDGVGSFSSSAPYIDLFETDTTDLNSRIVSNSSSLRLQTVADNGSNASNRLLIDHSTGDISFYNDSANQGLFWDSSTSRLGLGVTNPAQLLHLTSTGFAYARLNNSSYTGIDIGQHTNGNTYFNLRDNKAQVFLTNNTERVRINADGSSVFSGAVTSTGAITTSTRVFSPEFRVMEGTSLAGGIFKEKNLTGSGSSLDLAIFAEGISNGGDIHFYTGGAVPSKMTIASNGNVNISNGKIKVSATTAPVARVDIAGNSDTVPALKIGSSDTYGHFFYDSSATGDLVIKRGEGGSQSESMRLDRSTGNATFSGSVSTENHFAVIPPTTTNYAYMAYSNAGGSMYVGRERSSASGLLTGSTAYAGVINVIGAYPLEFGTNNSKRMTIDSSGNVGIGCSPSYPLDVSGAAGDVVRFTGDANNSMRAYLGSGYQIFQCVNSGTTNQFGYGGGNFYVQTAGTERMRIDSSGNVGIGIATPLYTSATRQTLTLNGSGSSNISFGVNGTGYGNIFVASNVMSIGTQTSANPLTFEIGGSEKARIDSSGNLLVGNTDSTPYDRTSGNAIALGDGLISSAQSGGNAAIFNRMTNDGSIVGFRKDGTSVGSIGTAAGNLYIVSNDVGLNFAGGGDGIYPATANGAQRDAAIDLGHSTHRFKDLYLSNNATAQKLTLTKDPVGTYSIEVDGTNTGQPNLIVKQSTSERLRIDNLGRVGIGTSSPIRVLDIATTTGGTIIHLTDDATGHTATDGVDIQQEGTLFQILNREAGDIRFGTDNATRMTIDSSGSVGIGQTSLVNGDKLTVNGNFNLNGTLFNGTSNNSAGLNFTSNYVNMYGYSGIRFYAQAAGIGSMAERMRVRNDGNVLIGKTADDNTTAGHRFHANGFASHAVTSDSMYLNRLSTDGAVLTLAKDSTTVGSIGTTGGDLLIGTDDCAIRFSDGGDQIRVCTTAGANRDGAIDLGYSDSRFKDLYLSGTANVQYAGATDTGIYFNGSFNAVVPYRPDTGVAVDDYLDLGVYSHRWDDIFATNGTIQTSDRNEKQDIESLTEAEERVAVAAKGLLKKFRWKSAVEDKGDDARIHFGIIAQDLQAAFEAEGLDAGRYGMFTSNTWTNEDGEEQTRMGVRYSELLAFIISAI